MSSERFTRSVDRAISLIKIATAHGVNELEVRDEDFHLYFGPERTPWPGTPPANPLPAKSHSQGDT